MSVRYNERSSVDAGYNIYAIYGEDANCELAGFHSNPHIGNAEGTFAEVLEYASKLPGFYQWGGGGYIKPLIEKDTKNRVVVLNEAKKLQLERHAKLNKLIKLDIDYLIDNFDNLPKEEIITSLKQLKNKLDEKDIA